MQDSPPYIALQCINFILYVLAYHSISDILCVFNFLVGGWGDTCKPIVVQATMGWQMQHYAWLWCVALVLHRCFAAVVQMIRCCNIQMHNSSCQANMITRWLHAAWLCSYVQNNCNDILCNAINVTMVQQVWPAFAQWSCWCFNFAWLASCTVVKNMLPTVSHCST